MTTIYNTLTRQKEPFAPIDPKNVRMYVCGMTVYDYCHLGHARVMVVFDMIARWLRECGYPLTYVRNITDIDDKIIARAAENGETIGELTARFIQAMHEDADALGVLRPDIEPKATENIPQMIAMIETLIQNGKAYPCRKRRRLLRRARVCRLRPIVGQIVGRPARGRTCGSGRFQTRSA